MPRLFGDTVLRAFDANGEPVSGARCYVYTAGTTTPVATYSDAALTTPQAHPVVADSSGVFAPIFVAAGSYKANLTTSADAALPGYPVDNLVPPESDGNVIVIPTGGTTARPLEDKLADVLSVFDFMDPATKAKVALGTATGSDATAITTAIQAAIDHAGGMSDGTYGGTPAGAVIFPAGLYRINATLTWPASYQYMSWFGFGQAVIQSEAAATPAVRIGDDLSSGGDTAGSSEVYSPWIDGLRLQTTAVNNTTTIGIQTCRAVDFRLNNCSINDYWISLDFHRAGVHYFNNLRIACQARNSSFPARCLIRYQGVYDSTASYTPGGGAHFGSCELVGKSTDPAAVEYGIEVKTIDGLYVDTNTHIKGVAKAHIFFNPDGTTRNNRLANININGPFFDGPNVSGHVNVLFGGTLSAANHSFYNVRLKNGSFSGFGGGEYGVLWDMESPDLTSVGQLVIEGGDFDRNEINAIRIKGALDSKLQVARVIIDSPVIRDGRYDGVAGGTLIYVDAPSVTIRNPVIGPEANAPARCVQVEQSSYTNPSLTLSGGDFSQSSYTAEAYTITKPASGGRYMIGPNLLADGWLDENTEQRVTVADDEVATVTIPNGNTGGMIEIAARLSGGTNPRGDHSGRMHIDCGATPGTSIEALGTNMETTTGALTGTTGTDLKTTISPQADGTFHIENRSGGPLVYRIRFV